MLYSFVICPIFHVVSIFKRKDSHPSRVTLNKLLAVTCTDHLALKSVGELGCGIDIVNLSTQVKQASMSLPAEVRGE